MVNYCCVIGCGRNSKQNKHLNYYSLPKDKPRQVDWLVAAGREDLLEKDKALVSHRFCSRHFPASQVKNKHLCDTAQPSLYLPGSWNEDDVQHNDIVCDSCRLAIMGFRYKCVTCEDFDLCQKCEMRETHPHHYMLRMPKPLKYKLADDLIQKWRAFFNADHDTPSASEHDKLKYDSDDEPITKYVRNYDSGVDLSEDVKTLIRDEVTRVLETPDVEKRVKGNPLLMSKKRMGEEIERSIKRIRMDGTIGYDDEDAAVPEVAFADVNDEADIEVKHEATGSAEEPPLVHVKLSEDLKELMIEMAPHQSKVT